MDAAIKCLRDSYLPSSFPSVLYLFCFVLFCFILFYFILFYFILFYSILFYFILFYLYLYLYLYFILIDSDIMHCPTTSQWTELASEVYVSSPYHPAA